MGYWARFYKSIDRIWNWIPTVDPNKISVLIPVFSIIYLYIFQDVTLSIILVIVLWLLDSIDGVMARRLKRQNDYIDLATDRVSELILFSPHITALPLVLINILFSVIKLRYKPNIPFILPMKQFLLIYLILLEFNLFSKIPTMGLF